MNFKKVCDTDIELIREYTRKADTDNCEFSVANIFMWNDVEKLHCAVFDEVLVYRLIDNGKAIYSPVSLPDNTKEFIEMLKRDALDNGCGFMLNNLSVQMMEQLQEIFGDRFKFDYDRADSDYIYSVEELIKLSGSKYHSKKNNLNKFLKNNEFVYEKISRNNIEECLLMKNNWAERKSNREEYEEELLILDKAFSEYEKFGFIGGLIRIKGEVVAFCFGEELNEEVFVTHFEKAYDDIPGLYQAINQQFAANSISGYKYVNREDDMGHEGIRKAKLSYKPVYLRDKFYTEQNYRSTT